MMPHQGGSVSQGGMYGASVLVGCSVASVLIESADQAMSVIS